MSARIIELAAFRASRLDEAELPPQSKANGANRFHFWTGASGKRYVHTVYELLDCPALPAANYVLVRREPGARRKVLSIGFGVLMSTPAALNVSNGNFEPPDFKNPR